MRHVLARSVLALALLAAMAACVEQGLVAPQTPTVRDDDGTLVSRVRSALATTPGVDAPAITVSAYRGIIRLSGAVANDAEREAAVQSARKVPGVRSVQDSLSVR